MHYVMRSKNIIFALILALVLASCSTTAPIVTPPKADGEIYYVAKVDITASDKQTEIESKYGAKAIFFNTEAGFAVLGFTKEAGELTSLTTSQNQNAFTSPEVSAQGSMAWAGGFSTWAGGFNTWAGGYNAWAGGFNAWAGGYNAWAGGYNAWAGGYNAWAGGLPMNATVGNNMHVWDRINLAEGQLRAPNLGEGIVVAVIDTGIDLYHPALENYLTNWTSWYDFVDDDDEPYDEGDPNNDHGFGHGTAVAGLVLKVAPNAKIMPLRVLDQDGNGDTDNVVSAISWAVNHGADVINISLGATANDPAFQAMINWASSQGVFVVASAGNADSQSVTYPAAYTSSSNKVISVGSVDLKNKKSSFSNYSSNKLDVVVPAEGLLTAFPNGTRASVQGTSFAAPIASGAVALALGQNPSTSRRDTLKWRIKAYGTSINDYNPYYVGKLGNLLNLENFLSSLGNSAPSPARTALFVVGSLPLNASDEFFKERLEQLGFGLTMYRDDYSSAGQATGQDLVVISSSVDASQVYSKFKYVAVPVITWEDEIFDDMSLAWDSGDTSNQTSIKIATSHPLSAGFAKYNTVKVYNDSSDPNENRLAYGRVYSAAIKIATVPSDSNKVVAFAYEKGAALGNIHAPAKRVGLFFQNYEDLPIANYGAAFFDAAVVWATNDRYSVNNTDKIWLEAESPSSVSGGFEWDSGHSWAISSGSYMTTLESLGDDYDGNGNPNAKLNYKLKIETSGTYRIWLRSYGADGGSNSFFVQTDGGIKTVVHFGNSNNGTWVWKKVVKYLSAGEHTLTIALREDGARLDKLLITRDGNYTPSGLGGY